MFTLNCRGLLVALDQPVVMGIINITPNSFYKDSRKTDIDQVLQTAEKMLSEGATFLDLGGQSTRPGSDVVTAEEELARVIPAVEAIHKYFPQALISIDTYYGKVAAETVAAGACLVNDISSGTIDNTMIPIVATLQVPYIVMHIKGTPATMQQMAHYADVALEVLDFFIKKIEECRLAGIRDIIIDPGFGFAKTIAHNFILLRQLSTLQITGKPILAGLSRKATIYKTLGIDSAEALNGTTVLNTVAMLNGANILRVHDVKEAMEVIKLVTAMQA